MGFLCKPELEDKEESGDVLLAKARAKMYRAYRFRNGSDRPVSMKEAISDWNDFLSTLDRSSDENIRAELNKIFVVTTI